MKWILPDQRNNKDILEFLLKSRGVKDKKAFLHPSIEQIYDPFLMWDMKGAVEAITGAIKAGKKIFIHGDFDVDGITATSIMWDFLFRHANANVLPYIPNRFDQGYGLSESSIEDIINQGADMIITVDCGIKDVELVNKYKKKVDFVITDHHTLGTPDIKRQSKGKKTASKKVEVSSDFLLPKALAIVHPKLNPDYPFTEISGAVVSWKVCTALNEHMKLGVDMSKYLDLAALGTVCDIMPLIDENRAIVRFGLEKMRQTQNVGLKSLLEIAGVDSKSVDTYHLGFILGPRLNASGRLESAIDAVRLLTTLSHDNARKISYELNTLNQKRQALTRELLELAEEQLVGKPNEKILFVYGEDWPEGIVGLIAGRLTEKYNRPTLVGSLKDGIIKGSARSIESFNIANALKEANHLLERHGGHAQAAGFSLKQENLDSLTAILTKLTEDAISERDLERLIRIDAMIDIADVDLDLVNSVGQLSPFGYGNPTPIFALENVVVKYSQSIGKDGSHYKFFVTNDTDNTLECVAFNFSERLREIFPHYSTSLVGEELDVAGNLGIDTWNGNKRVVLKVRDVRKTKT